MRLDPTFIIKNFQSLRNEVALDDEYSPHASDKLEVSQEQYDAYTALFPDGLRGVSKPMFDGLEIVVHTPPLAK